MASKYDKTRRERGWIKHDFSRYTGKSVCDKSKNNSHSGELLKPMEVD